MNQKILSDFDSRQDSLFYLDSSGRRNNQKNRVFSAFASCVDMGASDGEVAELLGVPVTSVIARRHDLMKENPDLFFVDGKRLASSGVMVDVYKIKRKV